MKEITFNYDTSDFSSMVHESNRDLDKKIAQYRGLMTETLIESAGIMNESVEYIMEQSSEHIGQKIMKILIAIKNWIVKTAQNITMRIRLLVGQNEQVLEKIRPLVENKMKIADSPLTNFKAQMFEYDLNAILPADISKLIHSAFSTSEYNVHPNYIHAKPEERDALDLSAKKVHDTSTNDFINLFTGFANIEEIKEAAWKSIRKGGERKTVPFDMKYFDIIASFKKTERWIQGMYDSIVGYVEMNIKEIDAQVRHMPNEHWKGTQSGPDGSKPIIEKIDRTKIVYYLSAKRKIINIVCDIAVAVNNEKLRAAVEQMDEAKKFCIAAYRLNTMQETIFEPFVVVTNDATFIEDEGGLLDAQFKDKWPI